MTTEVASKQKVGKVVQVIGPVVDIEFADSDLPDIYNAVHIVSDGTGGASKMDVICEVEQHLGENRVRTVAMKPTDGMQRGMTAVDLGEQITMPVGPATLGRVLNVLGEPVDYPDRPVVSKERWSIHRKAPSLEEQSTELKMFETGIKVVDLLEPYLLGGKIGLFGGAGERTREGNDLWLEFQESGVINKDDLSKSRAALVYGQMTEPPGARLRVALSGLTVAEYFRDAEGNDELPEEDRVTVARARKLQRFLSQPFFVASQFTGRDGKYVPVAETIRGFKEIVDGKHDGLPEQAFYMMGTIDEVVESAKKMATA